MSAKVLDRLYAGWTDYIEKARTNADILKQRAAATRKP
jgi:hypothetical protein